MVGPGPSREGNGIEHENLEPNIPTAHTNFVCMSMLITDQLANKQIIRSQVSKWISWDSFYRRYSPPLQSHSHTVKLLVFIDAITFIVSSSFSSGFWVSLSLSRFRPLCECAVRLFLCASLVCNSFFMRPFRFGTFTPQSYQISTTSHFIEMICLSESWFWYTFIYENDIFIRFIVWHFYSHSTNGEVFISTTLVSKTMHLSLSLPLSTMINFYW